MGSCQPRRSPMCPKARVQVLRRTGVLSVLMWPQNFLSLTIRPEEAGGSCQNGNSPKSSQLFTVCPEEARDSCQCGFGIPFFLGLTTGSDKAGVFCPHGHIPIFPEVYTGGPEDISVRLCGHGPMSSRSVTAGSELAGAPVTVDAAPSFQKTQFMS